MPTGKSNLRSLLGRMGLQSFSGARYQVSDQGCASGEMADTPDLGSGPVRG
ncbi:MAG: hypothetical protein JWM99_1945, partial [Verrucomicrobiales bacterium]|nr:hypothetical protein [Verrucomicrobiales bacterium]